MGFWVSIASSADGTILLAAADVDSRNYTGSLYTSTNSGASWKQTSALSNWWQSVASSADGTKFFAASGQVYASLDAGAVYASVDSGAHWQDWRKTLICGRRIS